MNAAHWIILLQLVGALAAGGVIGLERSRRGRQAGLREHGLVCLGSCQLVLIGVYSFQGEVTSMPFDPTVGRIIQGVMSGMGFLGAGGILKEGFSVRGLTTAASLWVTATVGVMIGIGFFYPAFITILLTLLALATLRWAEKHLVQKHEIQLFLRQARGGALRERDIAAILERHGCAIASLGALGGGEGRFLDYKALLTTEDVNACRALIETLANDGRFIEFSLTPLGEF